MNQFNAKQAYEHVTTLEEFEQWLKLTYDQMFEEIGDISLPPADVGPFSVRAALMDEQMNRHCVGMECLSVYRHTLGAQKSIDLIDRVIAGVDRLEDKYRMMPTR